MVGLVLFGRVIPGDPPCKLCIIRYADNLDAIRKTRKSFIGKDSPFLSRGVCRFVWRHRCSGFIGSRSRWGSSKPCLARFGAKPSKSWSEPKVLADRATDDDRRKALVAIKPTRPFHANMVHDQLSNVTAPSPPRSSGQWRRLQSFHANRRTCFA